MTEGLDLHLGLDKAAGFVGRVLRRLGTRTVATEDPGLGRHRDVLHAAGLAAAPLEVGPTGADPGGLTGQEMLVYVDDAELEQRRDQRVGKVS
jgi:hypothetical protein